MYPKTVYLPITITSANQLLKVANRNGWKNNPELSDEENLANAETFCFALYRDFMIKKVADPFIETAKEEGEEIIRQKVAEINEMAEQAVGVVETE